MNGFCEMVLVTFLLLFPATDPDSISNKHSAKSKGNCFKMFCQAVCINKEVKVKVDRGMNPCVGGSQCKLLREHVDWHLREVTDRDEQTNKRTKGAAQLEQTINCSGKRWLLCAKTIIALLVTAASKCSEQLFVFFGANWYAPDEHHTQSTLTFLRWR